ncbi:phage portal protein [Novosphingobium sp. FGD1]|uniref:Phage portal protein n=1 Tax=Novosphingobium silvae TaxID=2692619 RepID=A0A7X4GD56_9SPHN|nr:phage portal protein [Novosphingobium silvae]MYL96447.1 phage portal protein [Novosphingobium silvae]
MTEQATLPATLDAPPGTSAFAFGDPVPMLDRREIFDLFEVAHNGSWYEPPVSLAGLGRCYRMAPHHQSAILLKRNLLAASFVPSALLPKAEFAGWALDWLIMGNAYLERVSDRIGRPAGLRRSPAAYTRVGVQPGQFWWVPRQYIRSDAVEYVPGAIHHLAEPDPMQEIYGMPEYLSALQSGLLNESATLFRRKYYLNGSHAGYILAITDEGLSDGDSKAIRQAMRDSKGPGNFRNFFLHLPKGDKDSVRIIPIASVGANDEFLNIKNVTAEDLLAAHRVPPQLIGMVPKSTAGFGNVKDAAAMFYEMEIVPIQERMREVNDWLGVEAVRFERPAMALPGAALPV